MEHRLERVDKNNQFHPTEKPSQLIQPDLTRKPSIISIVLHPKIPLASRRPGLQALLESSSELSLVHPSRIRICICICIIVFSCSNRPAIVSLTVEMRPLDEAETTQVFEKLFKFTGNNLKNIVESPSHEGPDQNPGRYCFRLHKNRVYYVSESLVKRATNIKRENLVALGTNIGKFTKSGKFHLTIQALNLLAANAKHKVWLKPTSEMSFLYGNDVVKGGLGRITDNINAYDGVVVFSMSDLPLGFGIAAKSTQDCRKMDPNGLVVIRQADTGEYLRNQEDL